MIQSTDRETRCAAHPDVITGLRCGKCEKRICPRCLVHTPVGARCRDCARLRRLPVFDVSPPLFMRAAAAGVVAAVVIGLVLSSSYWFGFPGLLGAETSARGFDGLGSGWMGLLGAYGAGYGVGEVVSWAASRRMSPWLKVLAGACAVLTYVVAAVGPLVLAVLLTSGAHGIFGDFGNALLPAIAIVGTLLNPVWWLATGVAVYVAVRRIG